MEKEIKLLEEIKDQINLSMPTSNLFQSFRSYKNVLMKLDKKYADIIYSFRMELSNLEGEIEILNDESESKKNTKKRLENFYCNLTNDITDLIGDLRKHEDGKTKN